MALFYSSGAAFCLKEVTSGSMSLSTIFSVLLMVSAPRVLVDLASRIVSRFVNAQMMTFSEGARLVVHRVRFFLSFCCNHGWLSFYLKIAPLWIDR